MATLLIELPNGDFVDPIVITDIQYFAAGENIEERVIIATSTNRLYLVEFGLDSNKAKDFQRDIGKAINAARMGPCTGF